MASYKNLFNISGKVALVTGAAGFLGIHISKGLAEFGAKVILLDANGAGLAQTKEKLEKELPGTNFRAFECDITNSENVQMTIDTILGENHKIDILINNACTKGDDLNKFYCPSESYDFETYRQVNSVNVDGYFLMAQKGELQIGPRSVLLLVSDP